ncbi:Histone deacetylase domain [Trinorchestia longiramus]|nr:Histone deacetylase domain [Trinorchestia longiramus]
MATAIIEPGSIKASVSKDSNNFVSPLYDVAFSNKHVPVVYCADYNITLFGLERLHPFDSGKWGKLLKNEGLLNDQVIVKPREASKEDLLLVHKQRYLTSLKWSVNVAKITEVTGTALLPNCLLQKKILKPFRYQTGGSVVAGRCAVERGWSINVGGGFHHCSGGRGGGFCAYADITLLVHVVLEQYEHINNILIVDLDAHQGNGHERDFMGRKDVYIMDVYNRLIYPRDEPAKKAISKRIELSPFTEDPRYLQAIEEGLEQCLEEFAADLVIYNAGTDILEGDPLGLLSVSKKGVILRDEIVWQMVRQQRHLPLVMLTSGGYQRCTASVIADSISNLQRLGLVDLQIRKDSAAKESKKASLCSSVSPPLKYSSLLTRCGGKKKSSIVSASESSTPLSGRHSTTDSTTSSPPSHVPPQQLAAHEQSGKPVSDDDTVAPGRITALSQQRNSESVMDQPLPQQVPPSFIDIKPTVGLRHSVASACSSADYGTPRSTLPPAFLASPSSPLSSLRPDMIQQTSITDSTTPPSPAYRSVAGSLLTVNTSGSLHTEASPPRHKSTDSTLSLAQQSITSPPSHYQSADSISSSLANNSAFIPP